MVISDIRKPMTPAAVEEYLAQHGWLDGGQAPSLNLDKLREALTYGWSIIRVTFGMRGGPVVGEPGFDFAIKETNTGAFSIMPVACGKAVVEFLKEKNLTTEVEQ